jgi:hypothetical protein
MLRVMLPLLASIAADAAVAGGTDRAALAGRSPGCPDVAPAATAAGAEMKRTMKRNGKKMTRRRRREDGGLQ